MKRFTKKEMEILNKNFQNSKWNNARYEGDSLVADYSGTIWVTASQVSNGITTVRIYPSNILLKEHFDYGFDQDGWVTEQLDWKIW